MFIPKAAWRKDVLPAALRSNWDNPDRLYNAIAGALADGFAADVAEAATRLYAIDPHRSRATTILGIVMMKTDRLDEAEKLFVAYLSKHGEDAAVLTNLAKAYAGRGDHDIAGRTLWRALELDPNMDNAMGWYVAVSREKGGEEAEFEALRKVAAIPGSWRARIWLARKALRDARPEQALAIYNECLSGFDGPAPTDFLMQASGDLGNAGFIKGIIELCGPAFVPEVHGLLVGNNLMKAYIELSDFDSAARILERLQSMRRPDWTETLRFWEQEIFSKRLTATSAAPATFPSVTMLRISGPIWCGPSATRLFAPKNAAARKVAFLGASAERPGESVAAGTQLADAPGRMSRALPLFLAEQIHLLSNAAAETLVPYALGTSGGAVLSGIAFSDEWIIDCARRASIGDHVVATHLKWEAELWWSLELRLIRASDGKRLTTMSASFSFADPYEKILAVAAALLEALRTEIGLEIAAEVPLYRIPAEAHYADYLLRLEQLLALRCVLVEGANPKSLHGEREILDGNISLCLACPDSLNARLMLLQTTRYMDKIRPDVVAEFKEKLEMLQREHPFAGEAGDAIRSILQGADNAEPG